MTTDNKRYEIYYEIFLSFRFYLVLSFYTSLGLDDIDVWNFSIFFSAFFRHFIHSSFRIDFRVVFSCYQATIRSLVVAQKQNFTYWSVVHISLTFLKIIVIHVDESNTWAQCAPIEPKKT